MTNIVKIYFLIGFVVTLSSLCFCRNIAKNNFIVDKFLTIKKLDFFTKKNNIGLRLIGHLDLWTKNVKIEVITRRSRYSRQSNGRIL